MNLEQLRSFVEVARFGNFTRAAEERYLAQPSLSRQIAALEHDLGAELFHRSRGRSSLTVAGESLLPLARRMLADAESVRRELAELAGLERGRVRLGATPTLCISLVAEVLSAFHAEHPAIELHLSEHGSRRLLDELASGELDLALVTTSDAAATERFTVTPLLVEELVLISSAGAPPVSPRDTISLGEVAALPQIAFSSSYDLRNTTDAAFRAAGLTPVVVLEGAEMDAVLRFVERDLGVAIVPAMVLIDRPGLRSVRLEVSTAGASEAGASKPGLSKPGVSKTDGSALSRTISLARPADVAPTTAVETMRRTISQSASAFASRAGATMRIARSED
ncbi:LysR family transcriptional regulator [Agromyces aureus]|uniref:LysR family transcriptional regulator n=1 Tax=Agromyces aureus TaxID=453304 RepID=A0A191WFQ5_9MICO|nr:LysR family transcriptional regulator [Agromyces aureus]ANJ27120.1 LysR family transcriptional regulator [Agromyces aureus]